MTQRNREARSVAFEFARRLRDPEFRRFLESNKYYSGQTVVTALDDEPLAEVFGRIMVETSPPVVVAIRRASAPHGFVCMTIGHVGADPGVGDHERVGPTATIGMLYDAMAAKTSPRTVLTVPNNWDAPQFNVSLAVGAS